MAYDTSAKGDSRGAVPGKPGQPFTPDDWVIRVELDRLKGADALGGD